MTEAKVVELVTEWKNEMKGVVADYNAMLAKLDQAVTEVKESKKKWWVVYKIPITLGATLLLLFLFVVGISFTMKAANICVVNVNANAQAAFNSCKGEPTARH